MQFKWDTFLAILFLVIVFVVIVLIMFTTFTFPDTTVGLKPLM